MAAHSGLKGATLCDISVAISILKMKLKASKLKDQFLTYSSAKDISKKVLPRSSKV
jgi:hypothetical protein